MTIDEAIKHCEENAEMYEDRSLHVDDRPEEVKELDYALGEAWEKAGIQREEIDIFNPQRAADENRQLAEWLRELKEAKRLLKLAVKDITFILSYVCSDEEMCCEECPTVNHACNKWRFADEAEKLLKEEK